MDAITNTEKAAETDANTAPADISTNSRRRARKHTVPGGKQPNAVSPEQALQILQNALRLCMEAGIPAGWRQEPDAWHVWLHGVQLVEQDLVKAKT